MSDPREKSGAPLFLLGLAAGLAYLVPKALGLLDDVGGSHLNRDPEIALRLDPEAAALTAVFVLVSVLAYLYRHRVVAAFTSLRDLAERRPGRAAITLAGALFLLHLLLFVPFRVNLIAVPDPGDPRMSFVGRKGRLAHVRQHPGMYEDYTRNYVIANCLRRLGPGRYFELAGATELTGTERKLCHWALRNHPPGYHLLLTPFATGPVAVRFVSVVLYAACVALAFLLLVSLLGATAAICGAVLFFAVPSNLFFLGTMPSNDLAVAVVILTGLVLAAARERPSLVRLFLVGLVFGAAFLVKYTAVLALPVLFLVLLARNGFRRAVAGSLVAFAGALVLAVPWILVLSGTPWGEIQYAKYVSGLLGKATDPSQIGQAKSAARGTILDFLLFIPVELGFPIAAGLLASGIGLVAARGRIGRPAWLAAGIYAVPLVAAALALPKTNYIFFALPGLTGFLGTWLARRSRTADVALFVTVALLFGVARFVLYGLQTW